MDVAQAAEAFSALSPAEKTEFLARLAHALTMLARDTYEVGQEGLANPVRLRRINEVQHRTTSHLLALLCEDPNRYPDEILIRIILEWPDDLMLQQQLRETWNRLSAQVSAAA